MTISKTSILLAATLLGGCALEAGEELCVSRGALVASQGEWLDGPYLNGRYLNGRYLNGPYLNGRHLNGILLNGHELNGHRLNGTQLEGATVRGTELEAIVDGDTISGDEWIGAELAAVYSDGSEVPLTIAAVERDADDDEIVYVTLADEQRANVCGPAGKGLFVAGTWDATAAWQPSVEVGGETLSFSYSCTDGVIAKCIDWGYAPWRAGRALHQSCTRMARADYCGNGVSHTQNGTSVDVFDVEAIQVPATGPEDGYLFEAGWGPDGAVCAARPRYADYGPDGEQILPSCWSALPACASWPEAEDQGALAGNESVEQARFFCD